MKIFCVGRNYAAHAAELGNEVPDEPVIFMKLLQKVTVSTLLLVPESAIMCSVSTLLI